MSVSVSFEFTFKRLSTNRVSQIQHVLKSTISSIRSTVSLYCYTNLELQGAWQDLRTSKSPPTKHMLYRFQTRFAVLLAPRSLSTERKSYWCIPVSYPICRPICSKSTNGCHQRGQGFQGIFFERKYASHWWTDFYDLYVIWRLSTQECVLWRFWWYKSPLKGQSPKTEIFGAWIGIFKPNTRNIQTFILSKRLHGFQLHFSRQWRPPNMLRRWSRNAAKKSKMADGRHLEKSKNRDMSAPIWPILTKFSMHLRPPHLVGH